MAEPTLRDLLDAITKLDSRIEKVDVKVISEFADVRRDAVRVDHVRLRFEGEMESFRGETKYAVEGLQENVTERFDRVDKELAALDADPDGHMKVHREIEKDIEALKRRPARTAARPARRARTR